MVIPEVSKVVVNGREYPCVILIGRGENKERLKRRVPVLPYFYVRDKDFDNLEDFLKTVHVEEIQHHSARNIMREPLTKITVQDADRITENIKMVNKFNKQRHWSKNFFGDIHTIFTYEADVSKRESLPLRWLIDHNLRCGMNIEGNNYTPDDTFSVPLRVWYLDFEAYTLREWSTGMNTDEPLIMVSVWDTYEQKMYTLYADNPNWKTKLIFVPRTEFPHEIIGLKTEAKFLDGLMMLAQEKDPDLLVAWNLNRYDIEKWKQRCDYNHKSCVYSFRDLSPLKSISWHTRPHKVKGRVLFDQMVAFKQFTDAEMDSYALAYVTESEELGVEKTPFTGTSGNTWDKFPEIMFKRNVNDVLIMKALEDKHGVVDTYNELRKEFGLLFHEVFVRNKVIDTALLRMVHGITVLSTVSYGREESEKLLGAIVKEPEAKDYYWVAGLDLSRDYPNAIKGFNISPETYRDKPTKDCFSVTYDWEDPKTKAAKHFEAYFTKSTKGLLPQLIEHFDAMRTRYQKEMVKAIERKAPESEVKMWERRQYNIKKITNAIYGVMKYFKFRLHKNECTQATAIIGRIIIEELVKFLGELGYELIYGDTDSTFVQLKGINKEDCLVEGQMLQTKINEHLDVFFREKFNVVSHTEIGLKNIYKKIKFFAKKNYCGKYIWDEKKSWKVDYDYKGIASVRSDASVLEKTTLKEILKMDLDEENKEVIKNYIELVLKEFDDRKYDALDLAYPMQIKRKTEKDKKTGEWKTAYMKTIPSHVKAAIYTNTFMNTDFREGDKPRRLPVKFTKEIQKNQTLLFVSNEKTYPTTWEFRGKVRKVTDISIVEDFAIPKFFVDHIDYERIRKRLEGKLKLVNVQ